jgi:heptosyltransferase-2
MIRKLNIEPASRDPEIYLTEDEKIERDRIRKQFSSNGKFIIGINSTHGNSAPNIKSGEYRKLADKLSEYKVKIIVTDLNPPDELMNIPDAEYPNINSNLRSSIIIFSTLDLLISASTGPMHVAAALKVNTLSLFCPLPGASPELWGPLGNKSIIILPQNNFCGTGCSANPKNCWFEGTGGINAEIIFKEIEKIISQKI